MKFLLVLLVLSAPVLAHANMEYAAVEEVLLSSDPAEQAYSDCSAYADEQVENAPTLDWDATLSKCLVSKGLAMADDTRPTTAKQ